MPAALGDDQPGAVPESGDGTGLRQPEGGSAEVTTEPPLVPRTAEWVRDRERAIAQLIQTARDSGVVGGENPVPIIHEALAELDAIGSVDGTVKAEAHLALAWFQSMENGPRAARAWMDSALVLDPTLGWKVELQWAGMLIDEEDRHQEALAVFDRVIPQLPQDRNLVIALNNRGVLNNSMGRVEHAAADALAAADLAGLLGLVDFRSAALHNLGISYHYAGDLPQALWHMKAARLDGARVADGAREVDRGRVLFDAGLISEAAEAADIAVELADRSHWTNDLALAHVLGAKARAALGQFSTALLHARQAVAVFRERGAQAAADAARLVELRIRLTLLESRAVSAPAAAARLADQLEGLVSDLARTGTDWDVAGARIAAAAARQLAGQWDRATVLTDAVGPLAGSPLTLRLDLQWVQARARAAAADTAGALGQIRIGLDELSRFQSRLGSQDLQTSTSIHGVLLADQALAIAVAAGQPDLLLEWIERTRAVTSRLPTVRPPTDPLLAARLAEFRAVADTARQAATQGRGSTQAKEQADGLRREIRSLAWSGSADVPVRHPADSTRIRTDLGSGDDIAVEYLSFAGHLYAVVVHAGGIEQLDLGVEPPVVELIHRLNADLDLLAFQRIPSSIRRAASVSRSQLAVVLSDRLIGPLEHRLGAGTVSIAAVGELAGLAWSMLPALHGRPVRVNSSLSAAVHAVSVAPPSVPRRVLMVWGPGVPHAATEWETLAGLYPDAQLLSGPDATPSAVIKAIGETDLVHFATHGNHVPENPLFSGLHLHGGPLLAYDLAPVELPPQVVLSACEVGRTTDRPGGEPLGLATALLRSGVSTVIAATSRIADDEAARVLSDFHRGLAGGASAAAALSGALVAGGNTTPLTCFGA